MLRKLLIFSAFSVVSVVAVNAQNTPTEPTNRTEKRVQSGVLIAPFERSYLGIQTQEVTKENFSKFGLASVRGVGVEKVAADSPAAIAGLQTNDVIVRFNGEEVESVMKLTRLIAEVAPDHTAKLTILRGGGELEIDVTLGKREFTPFQGGFGLENLALPNIQTLPGTPLPQMRRLPPRGGDNNGKVFILRGDASRQIGIGVAPLTKQLGGYFGIADGKGLLIESVRDDSPAFKSGLKAGDVIIEVNGKAIGGQRDLIRAINDKKEGDVSLTIIRDRNRQTLRVTPEISKDGAANFEGFDNLFEATPQF